VQRNNQCAALKKIERQSFIDGRISRKKGTKKLFTTTKSLFFAKEKGKRVVKASIVSGEKRNSN